MGNNTPYELLGGEAGIKKLSKAFYQAMDQLPEAKGIRNMHKESLRDVEEKLFEYLSGWMGGPPLYQDKHGPCLTSPHKPYKLDESARDQWLLCMDHALDSVGAKEEVKAMLKQPLFNLADFMRNDK